MDENKIFKIINRINSIIFLFLMLAGVILIVWLSIQSNSWSNRRTVEVNEDPRDRKSPKIEMKLGGVNNISGHDVQYVELRSKSTGGKFSSGYSGGEIRNVLFIAGDKLDTHWLFPEHTNYIKTVSPLEKHLVEEKKYETMTMFYEFITDDTNHNSKLDSDDLSTIAISKPNGSVYTVIEKGVTSVIDKDLSKDGDVLTVLTQKNGAVYLKKYNTSTFELINLDSTHKCNLI